MYERACVSHKDVLEIYQRTGHIYTTQKHPIYQWPMGKGYMEADTHQRQRKSEMYTIKIA